jgi:hypothetical protein
MPCPRHVPAQVAVLGESPGWLLSVLEAVPVQADQLRLGGESAERHQVVLGHRPESDLDLRHHTSLPQ